MKWWAGLRGNSVEIVYSNKKPSYLTKVTKGYARLTSLINNSELCDYTALVSILKSSIR